MLTQTLSIHSLRTGCGCGNLLIYPDSCRKGRVLVCRHTARTSVGHSLHGEPLYFRRKSVFYLQWGLSRMSCSLACMCVCVPVSSSVATDNIFVGLRDAQVQRNLRRKQMMIDYRPLRQYYKHKADHATSMDEYLDWHRRLKKLPRDSSPTRYRNRCHVCGRARGYFRFFGLCRHHVLDMVRNAMLPGFTKAEW